MSAKDKFHDIVRLALEKEGVIAGKPLAKSLITSFRGSFKIE